jgi:hypothetical protein
MFGILVLKKNQNPASIFGRFDFDSTTTDVPTA